MLKPPSTNIDTFCLDLSAGFGKVCKHHDEGGDMSWKEDRKTIHQHIQQQYQTSHICFNPG